MKTKDLRITEIEFDLIKENLKNFLKSQSEFSGYNFEGSALNILLDILAYNTYYQAFYNNMTVNEMFLDSATKRSSIVSIAKHFAYRPKTVTSSRCQVEVTTTDITETVLPRGTRMTASKNGSSYNFVVLEDVSMIPSDYVNGLATELSSGTITVVEGSIKKYSFIADTSNTTQKFIIPFENVDASTLRVTVQPDISVAEFEEYYEATNITEIDENSKVYFLEENADGYLELIFGDGILGKGLSSGNVIRVEVLESLGEEANGIGQINSTTIFAAPRTINASSVRVIVPSSGGTSKETKESIRFNTTRNYVTQDRAVTKEDYRNILLKDFSQLEDVICWGGEDNDPIQYGKVFISVKPKEGVFLSSDEKTKIIQTITRTRNVVGVLVEFVDPEVLYLNLTVNVKIDPINLPQGVDQLISDIQEAVYAFTDENLNRFDKDFYSTELSTNIQSLDPHIISNDILVSIEKRFVPTFDAKAHNYTLKFNNKFFHPQDGYKSILSTNLFGYLDRNGVDRDCELEDDGYGKIKLFYRQNDSKVVISSNIGTIDYDNGIINLKNFKPSSLINDFPIALFCIPDEIDIIAKQKMFLIHENPSSISLVVNSTLVPYKNR